MKAVPKLLCLLAVALVLLGSHVTLSHSQEPNPGWSSPIQLDASLQDSRGGYPRMAVDAEGNLHLIWTSWYGENKPSTWSGNTIYYSFWNGTKWSTPVDIVAASQPLGATIAVTKDGFVIVLYEVGGRLYVDQAKIGKTENAQNWDTWSVGDGQSGRLAIDDATGTWYLSFVTTDRSIALSTSTDRGLNWTDPLFVWSPPNDKSAPVNGGVYVASDSSVQLVWSEHVERRQWGGEAIWHARLTDSNEAEPHVREVARSTGLDQPTLDNPVMAVSPSGTVHLFWNNGVGSTTGRFHQWSPDNGETWSETVGVFPGLSGQTSDAGLAFDSNDVLHLVTAANGDGYSYGVLRYASWQDGIWSPYVTLWADSYPGEHPSLALSEGNHLHLVWDYFGPGPDSIQAGGIMYSDALTGAQAQAPSGFSVFLDTEGSSSASTSGDTQEVQSYPTKTMDSSVAETPLTTYEQVFDTEPPVQNFSTYKSLLYGVLPAIFIVCGVLILKVKNKRIG